MLRFSHENNSWQVKLTRTRWVLITPDMARLFFDKGYPIIHFEQLQLWKEAA